MVKAEEKQNGKKIKRWTSMGTMVIVLIAMIVSTSRTHPIFNLNLSSLFFSNPNSCHCSQVLSFSFLSLNNQVVKFVCDCSIIELLPMSFWFVFWRSNLGCFWSTHFLLMLLEVVLWCEDFVWFKVCLLTTKGRKWGNENPLFTF